MIPGLRVLAFSDPHVTQGKREEDQRAVLARLLDDARSTRPDLIILGGDFYGHTVPHRSSPHERELLAPVVQGLADLAPVVIVYGNHDFPEDLEILGRLSGQWPIVVVTEPQILRVDTKRGAVDVAALPYPRKRAWVDAGEAKSPEEVRRVFDAKLREFLELWAWAITDRRPQVVASIFAGHVQVSGSKTGGGEVLTGGEPELTPTALGALPVDLAIIGHIHLCQSPARRAWYVGSPWPQDFGEKDPKGYLLADIGDGPPAALDPDVFEGRIQIAAVYPEERDRRAVAVSRILSGAPRLISLVWRWGVPAGSETPGWLEEPEEVAHEVLGCHVRARLHVQPASRASVPWEAVTAPFKACALSWVDELQIETSTSVRAPEIAAAESTPDKIAAYWRTMKPSPAESLQAAALRDLEALETVGPQAALDRIAEIRAES